MVEEQLLLNTAAVILSGMAAGNPNLANNMCLDKYRRESVEFAVVAAQDLMQTIKNLSKKENENESHRSEVRS